jgi:plastocyanin
MHLATLHLAPILAAGKSRVPFYIAGGVLVAWAMIVSVGLGLRRPDFPGNQAGERLVIAISTALVVLTAAMAVVTSGTPAKAAGSGTAGGSPAQSATGAESSPAPATPAPATPTTPTPSKPTKPTAATQPRATTGTPAPASSPAPGAAGSALKLAANPAGQLSFDTKQLSAKAGQVTITMTNMSPLEHDVTVASGSTVLGASPRFVGGSKTLTLSLKAGTYTFYCSVPGHRQAGMEGTLTVS